MEELQSCMKDHHCILSIPSYSPSIFGCTSKQGVLKEKEQLLPGKGPDPCSFFIPVPRFYQCCVLKAASLL